MSNQNDFFQNCQEHFEAKGFHSSAVKPVLHSLSIEEINDNTVFLTCDDATYLETLLRQEKFVSLLTEAARLTWDNPSLNLNISSYEVHAPSSNQNIFDLEDPGDIILSSLDELEVDRSLSPEVSFNTRTQSLIPSLTFDTFIRGQSNQMACAACEAAASNPGQLNNPVFIYGPTGLGKTHLLHSVGNAILKKNPGWKILYVTSGDFLKDLVDSIRTQRSRDFQQKYRDCDVLLVDDIQFLEKKEATQLEFFHTFNYLSSCQKQIVITSDKYPKDIPNIEERLKSRFLQGLIADVEPPSYEDRIAIIHSKMKEMELILPDEGVYQIASQVSGNVRELQGVLNTLAMESTMMSRMPNRESVANLLKRLAPANESIVTIPDVQKAVIRHFNITASDMLGRSRSQKVAFPRQIAMYLSRELTSHSTTDIAEAFERKDHTTVMHAISKIKELVSRDSVMRTTIKDIRVQIER